MEQQSTYQERELLAKIAEGDHQAFAQLLSQYHGIAYRTAMRLTGDGCVAEDVVQEVFLKIWLKRQSLHAIETFRPWLITIATNTIYDMIRKREREKNRLSGWIREIEPFSTMTVAATKEGSVYEELVTEAIQKLTPRQSEAFRLIKKDGYSREEAARLMKISPETVKTLLEQAMRTIRAYCIGRLDPKIILLVASFIRQKYL